MRFNHNVCNLFILLNLISMENKGSMAPSPQLMGFSAHNSMSDIESLSHSSFLYSRHTTCIYLYNVGIHLVGQFNFL